MSNRSGRCSRDQAAGMKLVPERTATGRVSRKPAYSFHSNIQDQQYRQINMWEPNGV